MAREAGASHHTRSLLAPTTLNADEPYNNTADECRTHVPSERIVTDWHEYASSIQALAGLEPIVPAGISGRGGGGGEIGGVGGWSGGEGPYGGAGGCDGGAVAAQSVQQSSGETEI